MHPAVKAAAAQHYLKQPGLADPMDPLAEAIETALVRSIVLVTSKTRKHVAIRVHGNDAVHVPMGTKLDTDRVPTRLHESLKQVVFEALYSSLGAQTELGKQLRMAIVGKLAVLESGTRDNAVTPLSAATEDEVLTTAQAAALLEVSRPYVSMLCDAGKLGEVLKTEGGHRRVRRSAVDAYRLAQTRTVADAVSPRQAAVDAGLYALDDEVYVNAGRRSASPVEQASKKPASKTKTARSPRA
jgi:excisionase family DNA binding protein